MEIVFINVIGTLLFLFESLYVNTAIFDLKTLSNFSIESRFMYRKAEKAEKHKKCFLNHIRILSERINHGYDF